MQKADKFTIQIKEYKGYFIITINTTPKLNYLGTGVVLTDFNIKDLEISKEVLDIFNLNLKQINKDIPVLEVLSKNRIWINTKSNTIIKTDEPFNIFEIPYHTICTNDIDDKLKEQLDKII